MKSETKKQFGIFSTLIILLTLIFLFVFYSVDFKSVNIFISFPIIISVLIVLFFLFILEKAMEARKDKNKAMRKNWQMGFFGFFAFSAIPGISRGEWIWAIWLVWVVWFLYLLPVKKTQA